MKKNDSKEKVKNEEESKESEILENIIAVLLVTIIIIGFIGFAKGWFTHEKPNDDANTRYDVDFGTKPLLGDSKSKVIIVEFSNYKCSHCKDFALKTLPKLENRYIYNDSLEKPLIAIAYRDFTIPNIVSAASKASIAAECANRQDKFWEFNKKLFENQDKLDDIMIRKIAKNLSLDMVKFEACLKNDNAANPMINDYTVGNNLRISGTPTFFINGKKIVGAKSFEEFSKIIDEEIKIVSSSDLKQKTKRKES